ncbi:MAG: SDR family NAD(P)-dependent oxidoreductase, partial [Planctomycetota bacterium]
MNSTIFDLSGRAALVTGGSKGIGKAIARIFAEAGADVMICSRQEDHLRAAVADIGRGTAARVEYLVADMSRREDVPRLAATAVDRLGKVDILVNNAGFNVPQAIDEIQDETWDRLVELNLTSCMALTRALAPGMKQRGWGRVIHISSIMGLASSAERSAYSATKSALLGLARAGALDLGPSGITVNCIAPGPIATEMPMSIL